MKTAVRNGKHGASIVSGKEMVLGYTESRKGFRRIGKGRSFHVDGKKTEKARAPTVESLVRGICSVRVSEAEWRIQRVDDLSLDPTVAWWTW